MKRNKFNSKNKNWDSLVNFISEKFGSGEKLDLQAILFLIGVNELGQGYRLFTKDEKINLLHIAICKLLSKYGYYQFVGKDDDGWPHWKTNSSLPALKPGEQTILMKEAAILYFIESKIEF
ncbi:MAG: hypothetical protein P8L89_03710 [Polaribacter sp.]|nr:hypothetical protein [Polaribacter sp.]